MNKIKPNPKYLHPINAVILGIMIAISLLVIISFYNKDENDYHPPIIRELEFQFNNVRDCNYNGHNIVIEYSDGVTDYNKYNTISDSLFTNYICINIADSLAYLFIDDYKEWAYDTNRMYACMLNHAWYIEERIIGKKITFTLKEKSWK
jgi:hypothetical protein